MNNGGCYNHPIIFVARNVYLCPLVIYLCALCPFLNRNSIAVIVHEIVTPLSFYCTYGDILVLPPNLQMTRNEVAKWLSKAFVSVQIACRWSIAFSGWKCTTVPNNGHLALDFQWSIHHPSSWGSLLDCWIAITIRRGFFPPDAQLTSASL